MSQRTERVQRLVRRVLGELIQRLKDPRIGFVTITAVRVTPDLKQARVFVSVYGTDEEQKATMAGLKSANAHLRTELGHEMPLRFTPELIIEHDTSPAEAQHMEELLHRIHTEEGSEH